MCVFFLGGGEGGGGGVGRVCGGFSITGTSLGHGPWTLILTDVSAVFRVLVQHLNTCVVGRGREDSGSQGNLPWFRFEMY